ncbi:hypothetical protein [Poseidonibacter ostreae]|uniref:Uncharacterized protein n=1 Tax=Poseidonibacter ostreae TaxID=2654171 RepID=A0A6L4WXE8_9BACT|nr:hypothetical protein [Poseidonibacter ostreae]KAB7891433.1 hypothetical protein GBG19_00930 [Poseidonibacter ostreae]
MENKNMGMCKDCGEVYSALIMKDGYCSGCKPEIFTERELKNIKEQGIKEETTKEVKKEETTKEVKKDFKEEAKKGKYNFYIGLAVVLGIATYFVSSALSLPKDEVVKNIASQYGVGSYSSRTKASKIDIIDHYKKEGKVVYILGIEKLICEMPMLEVKGKWTSLGMDCK